MNDDDLNGTTCGRGFDRTQIQVRNVAQRLRKGPFALDYGRSLYENMPSSTEPEVNYSYNSILCNFRNIINYFPTI